jgi:hypothetical protein
MTCVDTRLPLQEFEQSLGMDSNTVAQKFNKHKHKYVTESENEHPGYKVMHIRMDGGREYASVDNLLKWLEEKGIKREITTPHTPQSNAFSERLSRTIMDPSRTMLKAAGMPNKFWAEAVSTAVYRKDRLPTKSLQYDRETTPTDGGNAHRRRGPDADPNSARIQIFHYVHG